MSETMKLTWTKDFDLLGLVSEQEELILKASQSTLNHLLKFPISKGSMA